MHTHALLLELTAALPCRLIDVGGLPYLERYFVNEDADGGQNWLHRFLRQDTEEHLHNHPFIARSTVLVGWYIEEYLDGLQRRQRCLTEGQVNEIVFGTMHRITSVQPNTWTLMQVKPERRESWDFLDYAGQRRTVRSGGADWWKHCGTRADLGRE